MAFCRSEEKELLPLRERASWMRVQRILSGELGRHPLGGHSEVMGGEDLTEVIENLCSMTERRRLDG